MMDNEFRLSESIEDYIEKLYLDDLLCNKGVRVTDLAKAMQVSKASANDAVRRLQELGFVNHEKYKPIYLTDKGKEKGAQIFDRHTTITQFINEFLGVELETAEKDACAIEHILSEETFIQIKSFLKANS